MAQRTNLLQSKGKNNVTESRASCVLDCEAEDAMAFMWDSCSDTKMKVIYPNYSRLESYQFRYLIIDF